MRHHLRPIVPVLALYLCVFLGCVSLTVSCGADQRQKTLHASVLSVNAARDGLLAYDGKHQHDLVEAAKTREEGEASLATYRAKRAVVVAAFEVAYRALALAATATDDASYQDALKAAAAVLDAVKSLTGGS